MSRNPLIKDVPKPTDSVFLVRMGEAVSRLLGFRGETTANGEYLDRALTPRDLLDDGFRQNFSVGTGTGGTSVFNPGTGSGGGGDPTVPDLTPPPTPTGLVTTAGLTRIYVEWDEPFYTQGHGHGQTNIYVAKYLSADPTLPTFTDAVLFSVAPGALMGLDLPSDISIRWHIWIKWQSVDGVESSAPAGGTNGSIAQTGKIGNVDLGPLIVEAGNLASQDFNNLVLNPDGRNGNSGWVAEVIQPTSGYDPVNVPYWGGPYLRFNDRDTLYGEGFKVEAGEQYHCKAQMIPNLGGTSPYDCGIGLYFFDTLANAQSNNPMSASPNSLAQLIPGSAIGMRVLEGNVTIPTGARFAKPWIVINVGVGALPGDKVFYAGNIDVRRRTDDTLIVNGAIKAFHLAANSIAVGTAAIQNGAIINAMLGNATIDSAKIASLNANTLTAGDGTVGGILKSANFVSGSGGWYLRPGDGYFEASNAVIRGGIFASYGTIGGSVIASTYMQSTNYVANVQGWRLSSGGTGQIGGIVVEVDYLRSANWSGPGGAGWAVNTAGQAYFNNIFARGDITATSLSAATGTFTGALSAATGTFSGNLSAAGGTFVGALSAASGTFAGSLTASAINAVNSINIAGNAVSVTAAGSGVTGIGSGSAGAGAICDITIQSTDIPAGFGTVPVVVNGDMEFGWFNCGLGYKAGQTGDASTVPMNLAYRVGADPSGSNPDIHFTRVAFLPPGAYRFAIYGASGSASYITAVLGKR